jgi:hypothetical protein
MPGAALGQPHPFFEVQGAPYSYRDANQTALDPRQTDQRGHFMDTAEYWAICARVSEIENPISPEKLNLTEYCEVGV